MPGLHDKNIVVGVSAGVAAYKSAELVRLLVKEGATVQVVMTASAEAFIAPMTFQALTGLPVRGALFDAQHEAAMGHIELARWADVIVIAPATADVMAQMAMGTARDLLTTLYLATDAPVVVAPAMNQAMWRHPATRTNADRLQSRGVALLGPAAGEQACGDVGPGRMIEPAGIVAALAGLTGEGRLAGRRIVLTAGPTREAIDPVRFVGNRSSGKMGFALARAFVAEGADVVLVAGPVSLPTPAGVTRVDVESALQMRDAVFSALDGADIFVACAAVADFRPVEIRDRKIKKTEESLTLTMVRNPDILSEVSSGSPRPFCVGFAAETHDVERYAEGKRQAKRLDMIAANQVGAAKGFESDDNALLVLWEGGRVSLPEQSKSLLASRLTGLIAERFDAPTAA